eukprot:gb/GEZN01021436.1/.p1 GENE.gb/GEZN01021436.1/~~gb/GEZN01021436.1/.p1  ORF type:complete len:176 (+),score=18.29 gb/GEZN01021436.1/:81-608(+)
MQNDLFEGCGFEPYYILPVTRLDEKPRNVNGYYVHWFRVSLDDGGTKMWRFNYNKKGTISSSSEVKAGAGKKTSKPGGGGAEYWLEVSLPNMEVCNSPKFIAPSIKTWDKMNKQRRLPPEFSRAQKRIPLVRSGISRFLQDTATSSPCSPNFEPIAITFYAPSANGSIEATSTST